MSARGRFVTFEGIDGAGKSTHIGFTVDYLKRHGKGVVSTREPGGTPLSETLRELVLHQKMHLETEALLVFAARREHLALVIEPALERGEWVVSDRFTDSSFAYQGGGRGLSKQKLEALEQWVHPHLQPDLTLLFDVPPDVSRGRLERSVAGGRALDKFEREKAAFFERVREGYLARARAHPRRFRVVDSSRPLEAVRRELAIVLEAV